MTQMTAQEDIIEIYHNFNESYCNSEDNLKYFMIVTIFVDRHVCSRQQINLFHVENLLFSVCVCVCVCVWFILGPAVYGTFKTFEGRSQNRLGS